MYTVYSNTTCLMDPSLSLLLIDPVLDLAMNEAGSFFILHSNLSSSL